MAGGEASRVGGHRGYRHLPKPRCRGGQVLLDDSQGGSVLYKTSLIEVRFKASEEHGRQTAVHGDYYGCPFIVDDEAFDCRLLLSSRYLELGKTYQVPVKFMNWQLVRPKLSEGKAFILGEGKAVATGKVVRLEAGD